MHAQTHDLLIRNVLLGGRRRDVAIAGNRFACIADRVPGDASRVIDGTSFAIVPPYYNGHTHAAMTLLRGYGDDRPLDVWLRKYIWPAEACLTPRMIYRGTRLAIVEMLHSGTVFFNDMYWEQAETVRAVEELGIRAAIGVVLLNVLGEQRIREAQARFQEWGGATHANGRVQFALAPHAIYTVDEALFRWCARMQDRTGCLVHTHLCETAREVLDCREAHGVTPVELLERCGLLNGRTVAAHAVHLTPAERALLAARQTVLVHNPCSNSKLAVGCFDLTAAWQAGCRVALGTDGCASSNDLDMGYAMRFAALTAKAAQGRPDVCPAERVYACATREGARACGVDGGEIAEGHLADALLVRLDSPRLQPIRHLESHLVHAADSACIDTVICDGRVVMQGRRVPGEERIVSEAAEAAEELYAAVADRAASGANVHR
ncbi:MAG: amidohydrolase [Kiritimatiellae bacterium]|nr:amidohydrolase [Kiritimatiellia bacterium]